MVLKSDKQKRKRRRRRKKKVLSSFCDFSTFHFQFYTFPFTIFLIFFYIFTPFPFFPCLFFPGRLAEISRSEVSGGHSAPLLRHWEWTVLGRKLYIHIFPHMHGIISSKTSIYKVWLNDIFVTHHIKTGQLSVECISRYYSICMGKNKENKKRLRLIFDHKIAMLHPIYTWVVSSLS